MNDQKNNNSFVIGVLVGAALTYVFTTKKGQKLKEQILKEGNKLLETLSEELEEGKDKAQELIEAHSHEVKEKIAEGEKVVAKEADNLKEEIQEKVEDVPKQVAEIQKKGRRFFFRRGRNRQES